MDLCIGMKRIMSLVPSILALMLVQPASINAITDIDDICIKQAYKIGHDLTETNDNIMNALAEADCVYSGMMSQEAKCLVWFYDTGIRVTNLITTSPNSTDLSDYYAESNLILHECTNLDLLIGRDEPLMNAGMKS